MAFHFHDKEAARAAIYDAALLLLQADAAVSLPIGLLAVTELSELCRAIEQGRKISRSPVLDL
jgi:hypothetical protein